MVEIGEEQYEFSDHIGENPIWVDSFNDLARSSFGIQFSKVGGDYEPHVLQKDNVVCANISVNKIPFFVDGKQYLTIQLGTVMTRKEYRGKGLSRYLMEKILAKWKDKCDMIYLFANDTVLEFYPKFGFVKEEEYEYQMKRVVKQSTSVRKLSVENKEDAELLWEKYQAGNPFSNFAMRKNRPLIEFYCFGFMKENLYYIKEADAVVVAEYEDDMLIIDDIFGGNGTDLKWIIAVMERDDTTKVSLGFTPKATEGFECKVHKEEDTTLFIHRDEKNLLANKRMMFPLLSHA